MDEGVGAGGEEVAAPRSTDLPRVLVIGPGSGPALYLSPDANAAAFGFVNPGVRVRVESGVQNGRVEVLVAGPLPTKGWVPSERLAMYAQQRGRVEGTPVYLGPNDLVNVLGPGAEEGQMRVAVRPWLGGELFLDPQVGTFAADLLDNQPVDAASVEGPTEGECFRLPPGQTVPVYQSPNDPPVTSLPAQDPPLPVVVLRNRAPWYGIRAGYGPYVVGYVQAPLTPCEGAPPAPAPMVPTGGERPYWMTQEPGALYRIAVNTPVTFGRNPDGTPRVIARLRQEGWAREIGREDGHVDVFLAVDDNVALRGLVPETALTLVEAGATPPAPAVPPAPAPAPAEPLPDELAE